MGDRRRISPKFTRTGFGAAYYSIAVVSILFINVFFVFLVNIFGATESALESDWFKLVGYLLSPVAIIGSLFLFSFSADESLVEVCGARKTSSRFYLYAILLFVAAFLGLSGLNGMFIEFLSDAFGYEYSSQTLPSPTPVNVCLTIIEACLLPAIAEEAFFRGCLARSLEGLDQIVAALVGGAYFALFHMNPAQTPYQFVLGFAFTLLALKSKSVFPTVLAHFLNNLAVIILNYAAPDLVLNDAASIILVAIGLALTALFFFLILREKSEKQEYPYDYKTFFSYSSIGVVACVVMWISGLIQ